MQKHLPKRLKKSRSVRRRLGEVERLENRRLMAVAPEVVNDLFNVQADQTFEASGAGVLANDVGLGGTMSAQLFSGPANGTMTLNEDGSFLYTPNPGFTGLDSFMYWANEGDTSSMLAAVTLRVSADGDGPITQNDTYSVDEDGVLSVPDFAGVLDNDTPMTGDSLTAELLTGPANGTLSFNEDGSFTYTPNADFFGEDAFTYIAYDASGSSEPTTVTINVAAVNDKPAAANDGYVMEEDGSLVTEGSVLENDADADGDTLTASLVSGPLNGTVTFNEDGTFSYTPNADFHGIDGFSYLVNDGTSDSEVATVTIRVTPVNDAPVAADDAYTLDEDTTLTVDASGILANDSDIDGDTLTPVVVTGPQNGTLTLNEDGSFSYTPNANFSGVDTFTYVVNDGAADSVEATVTLTVVDTNDAPVANNDEYTIDEDATLNVDPAGVLTNDVDGDGDTLTAVLVNGPQNGTLTFNADGSFSYTPNADFHGVDGFSYLVNDGTADSDVATVTINVTPANDAPVASDDEYAVDEDSELVVEASGVLGNDTDVDGDTLIPTVVTGPQNGTLTLNEDGSFTYVPNADFSGVDTFTYTVSDGTTVSNEATVTINVNSTNDAPVANGDEYAVDEDGELVVDASGVLGNDTDADGDTLIPTVVTGPQNGTLTLNEDGSFTYVPNADFNGVDTFTYTVSDGTETSAEATVTITVNAVNDAPVANNDEYTVDEDSVLNVDPSGILGNDTDADGDTLTPVLVSGPQNGTLTLNEDGSFTYTPNPDFSGVDGFSYVVSDGVTESAVATVTLNVAATNDAPTAADDEYSVDEDSELVVDAAGILGNDSDPEGDTLTPTVVTGPQNGTLTLNEDGSFSYVPNAGFNGVDTFTYTVSDGTETSAEATVTITVNAVNDAPEAVEDSYTVDEDAVLTVEGPGVLGNDSDPEGDPLTAVLVTGPQNGTLTLNEDGSFVYTPAANFNGTDTFTYKATDGSAESQEVTVSIVVNPMPDAPRANDDGFSTGEDSSVSGNVLANDFDPEGNPMVASLVEGPTLIAELVEGPQHGTLELNSDGTFTYTPNADYFGVDSFTYVAKNGEETSLVATATIHIDPINDAPVAAGSEYTVVAGETLTIDAAGGVLAGATDVESDPLTVKLLTDPANGTLVMSEDGSFTYTPDEGFSGTDKFYIQANDGKADSNVVEVVIQIEAASSENTAPVGAEDSYVVAANETLTIDGPGVLANDTDAEGDALAAVLVQGPSNGTLTLGADGSLVYTPNADYVGADSFTYVANDGQVDSEPVTVTITVGGTSTENSAPESADDAYAVDSGATLNIAADSGVLVNDADANGDALTAVLVDGPSHGTIALAEDGSFAYTPEPGYSGTDTFSYYATDGALAGNVATVTITIAATENGRPEAVNDQYQATADQTLTVDAAGVLANDFDPQGDPLTAELFSGPQHGVVTLSADGSFAYTPDAGYAGVDSFIYRTFDGERWSALAAVTIRVNAAPPEISDSVVDTVADGHADECVWNEEMVDALFGSGDPLA